MRSGAVSHKNPIKWGEIPPYIALHWFRAERLILPVPKSERLYQFERFARLKVAQFDTHRTRQIAAKNGGIV